MASCPRVLAFAMGYATDALAGSHPGLNAFMMTMVFLVSYEISTRLMVANAFVGATLVFFGVIATSLGTVAIANGFGALSGTGSMLPGLTLQALISAIIAPIVFSILAVSKRLWDCLRNRRATDAPDGIAYESGARIDCSGERISGEVPHPSKQ